MKTIQLAKGLTISISGAVYEFTDRTTEELNFQNPETGKRLILSVTDFWTDLERGVLAVLDSKATPKALIVQAQQEDLKPLLSDLDKKYLEDVERKLRFIQYMQSQGISRGQRRLIASALNKLSKTMNDPIGFPGASTVQAWWKKHDASASGIQALISGNAFRHRRGKLDKESEFFLQDNIGAYFANDRAPSIASAFSQYQDHLRAYNKACSQNGRTPLTEISARSFYNYIKKLPQFPLEVARHGYEHARRTFKVSKGALPALFPLDVLEIDHTLMNLYVIDDLTFLPLGRPTTTALKDRNTHILMGMYLSFHGGGLESISGAIKHSLQSHRLAFELWDDLENPWPSYGLGQIYSSDRGSDYFSPKYRAMILDLGAHYEYCEVRTPWLKGSIERFFLTLEKTFFETLPGKTFNSLANRKDYNPEKHAVIRFSTLVYLLHKWAVDFHNVSTHSRKKATPLELWMEGIEMAPPRMPASFDTLNLILGNRCQGSLRNEGVQYLDLHYADDTLQELVNRVGKGVKVDFILTPENLGQIYVKDPQTQQYLKINSVRPDYTHGLTLFQHKYIRQEAKLHSKQNISYESLFTSRQRINEVIQEEIYAKDTNRKKQLARIAAINSNAVLENQKRSIQTPFANQENVNFTKQDEVGSGYQESPFTNVVSYAWG